MFAVHSYAYNKELLHLSCYIVAIFVFSLKCDYLQSRYLELWPVSAGTPAALWKTSPHPNPCGLVPYPFEKNERIWNLTSFKKQLFKKRSVIYNLYEAIVNAQELCKLSLNLFYFDMYFKGCFLQK